jgi:hypothetical protein
VAERIRVGWVPRPDQSRYIPEHAEVLYVFLQDHAGEFWSVEQLMARRGGPREDLEAALGLLVTAELVATLPDEPPRYGAREPRVLEIVHGPPSPTPVRRPTRTRRTRPPDP